MNLIEQYERDGKIQRITESGCWIWMGAIMSRGYGSLSRGRLAHRVSYEEFFGSIPAGKQVLHKCDVKCCVNPSHLYAGTHKDNVLDNIHRLRYADNGKINSDKTQCKRGHEFTEENTYNYNGHRHCKACWKLRNKGA